MRGGHGKDESEDIIENMDYAAGVIGHLASYETLSEKDPLRISPKAHKRPRAVKRERRQRRASARLQSTVIARWVLVEIQ